MVSFSRIGFQDSISSSVMRSVPHRIASIASSLSIPNTRALIPSLTRARWRKLWLDRADGCLMGKLRRIAVTSS